MKTTNKKGAIELSIGTIVIIVIAMSMLILGLVLVRTIFTSAITSVTSIDAGVKNKIQQMFSEDEQKKIALIPDQGIIELKQGEIGSGFALSIRNTPGGGATSKYSYAVSVADPDIQTKCGYSELNMIGPNGKASITAGKRMDDITLADGNAMDTPVHVRFSVAEDAPICIFRLQVSVTEVGGTPGAYASAVMDVKITPK
jgi:hypothetical protein